jgi:leucyl-tRNA synthetase
MDSTYQPKNIEQQAQSHWRSIDAYRVTEHAKNQSGTPKPKFYACSMLPYPSGKLHMGHVRNYTINDVMLRHLRMKGYNVLMPMGWDAFGMPAENAAIANGAPPAAWTYQNIADMKTQMQPLGLAIDWSREITTCKPDYYKWNQWLFLKMLEKGIAYRKTQVVNWDPVDQTVLANEQVIDGRGWRSGALVEKKEIPGYYLAITQYADELLDSVKTKLTGWPSQVRTMQENWIGKSEGVRFAFHHTIRADESSTSLLPLQGEGRDGDGLRTPTDNLIQDGKLFVFTTRADTIMGVTFCAVAAEHPLALHAAKTNKAVADFIEKAKQGGTTEVELAIKDKEGVATGLFVTHPLTSAQIPVWVGNYVLMTYGDGAVMGVPAHDERDFQFAKKYEIAIKPVIDLGKPYALDGWQAWYGEHGVCVNSGVMNGMTFTQAIDYVAAQTNPHGGEKKTTWRLRDWGISRQRYWGAPIPIIHCDDCGAVPVPEKDLPVILPENLIPDGSGNPLKKDATFLNCTCPKCGKPAKRETDTMDTFVDSSWYYMRYCNPDSATAMVDARNDYWMPMDQYIGGIEHAVLHLLYARFWTKVMRDIKGELPNDRERGIVKFDEPFTNLFTQGMLSAECFYRPDESGKKRWYYPSEITVHYDDKGRPTGATSLEDGQPVLMGGMEKMSKSKNNVVEPKDIIARFGADTARAYVMFAGPPELSAVWSDSGAEGVYRFLKRLYDSAFRKNTYVSAGIKHLRAGQGISWSLESEATRKFRYDIHNELQKIDFDYKRMQYNTVVSGCMKLLNFIDSFYTGGFPIAEGQQPLLTSNGRFAAVAEAYGILLRTLYPLAPHITWQLWNDLGYAGAHGDLLDAAWPTPDPVALTQDEIELVVQVNGKLRGQIRVPKDATKEAIEALALADASVARHTEGATIKKLIVVPGRLINVVI